MTASEYESRLYEYQVKKFHRTYATTISNLFDKVSHHFTNIHPVVLYTPLRTLSQREEPVAAITWSDNAETDFAQRCKLFLDLVDLLTLTQQTDHIFTLIPRLFNEAHGTLELTVIKRIWEKHYPYPHYDFAARLTASLDAEDWYTNVLFICQLRDTYQENLYALECCESILCSIIGSISHELLSTDLYVDFYRNVYDGASKLFRIVLANNLGRPLGYKEELTQWNLPRKYPDNDFFKLYQYYEHRITLYRMNVVPWLLDKVYRSINITDVSFTCSSYANCKSHVEEDSDLVLRLTVTPDWLFDEETLRCYDDVIDMYNNMRQIVE